VLFIVCKRRMFMKNVDEACSYLNLLSLEIYNSTKAKGFWDTHDGGKIALIHMELLKALEAIRNNSTKDSIIKGFNDVDVELADAVIGILGFCGAEGIDIGKSVYAKMEYNKTR